MSILKHKYLFIISLLVITVLTAACDYKTRFNLDNKHNTEVSIYRYDKLESRYLTTGDFSAIQQMSTDYPVETRTLIEDILQIGNVTEPDINSRFLQFFQDTTLQELISDTEIKFVDISKLNEEFTKAFTKLIKEIPEIQVPSIYTQIGGLNQSIVVNNKSIGICLDKYLGSDYHIYKKFYSMQQRRDMNEDYIVPDAVGFYLVSLYQLSDYENRSQIERDLYLGKILWVTNYLTGKKSYNTTYVRMVNNYMHKYKNINIEMLLDNDDYEEIIKTNRE